MASNWSSGRDPPGRFRRAGLAHVLPWGDSILLDGPGEPSLSLRVRVPGVRDGLMVSGDIRNGVPYAKEVRDLARQTHRLCASRHASRRTETSRTSGRCCGGSTHSGDNSSKSVDPTCCHGRSSRSSSRASPRPSSSPGTSERDFWVWSAKIARKARPHRGWRLFSAGAFGEGGARRAGTTCQASVRTRAEELHGPGKTPG